MIIRATRGSVPDTWINYICYYCRPRGAKMMAMRPIPRGLSQTKCQTSSQPSHRRSINFLQTMHFCSGASYETERKIWFIWFIFRPPPTPAERRLPAYSHGAGAQWRPAGRVPHGHTLAVCAASGLPGNGHTVPVDSDENGEKFFVGFWEMLFLMVNLFWSTGRCSRTFVRLPAGTGRGGTTRQKCQHYRIRWCDHVRDCGCAAFR